MTPAALPSLARGDLRERTRRPGFLLTVLAAVALGYLAVPPTSATYTLVKVGSHRGVYDSDYVGVMLALVGSLWIGWLGFFVVRGGIARDVDSRVGELLAATPMGSGTYLLAKFVSNLAVLVSMIGMLALTAPVMQLLREESGSLDLVALWIPFVALAVPTVALVAAAAVAFETVPLLRSVIGTMVWLVAYPIVFFNALPQGLGRVTDTFQADVAAQHGTDTEISIGLTGEDGGLDTFTYSGLDLPAGAVVAQVVLVLVSVLLVLAPAVWFHRFDPSRNRPGASIIRADHETAEQVPPAPAPVNPVRLPRTPVHLGLAWHRLVVQTARIRLAGTSGWWWATVFVVTLVSVVLPREAVGTALLVAWLLPVLPWSRLGVRHAHDPVPGLLDSTPSARRDIWIDWSSGVLIAALTGIGPLARMAVLGDSAGMLHWLAGALCIPAVAVCVGRLGRSPLWFQVGYLGIWYLMLNAIAAVDVMGAVRDAGAPAGPSPFVWLALAAALLTITHITQELRHARR